MTAANEDDVLLENLAPTPARELPTDIFDPDLTFAAIGLRGSVLKSLEAAGFQRPTKIQALLIPKMLEGKDMLGQARTGTGKTAAFALPILHLAERGRPFQALILVPTRELCIQVAMEINELGKLTPLRATAVYGGQRIRSQVDALAKGPEIIVSTPGRLMDMVERQHLHLRNVRYAVLDEVDRMLDIGFREDIRRILKLCPPPRHGQPGSEGWETGRQTVMVSATISGEIEKLARQHCHEAEKVVAIYSDVLTNSSVKQFHLPVIRRDKKRLLLHLLTHEEPALTVVFCRMKRTVDEVARYLVDHGIDAHPMHGDMMQNKRNRVIEKLHKGDLSVLVASDLAARGIDVDGITHVINYDMPEDPEVYVHRIGRTARVGREGVAWSFLTPMEGDLLTSVEHLINAEVPKLDYPDFRHSEPEGEERFKRAQTVEEAAAAAPSIPARLRAAPELPVASSAGPAAVDLSKFPGGIVPSKMPPRRMFGKVKGRG